MKTDQQTALLQPPPSVDLSCPGLMVTANLSIILGYLWFGWISTPASDTSSPTATLGAFPSALRGWVLPILIGAAIVALRPACGKRSLRGSTRLLPTVAAVEVIVTASADVTGSGKLAVVAGSLAVLLATVAIGSVLLREAHAKWPPDALPAHRAAEQETAGIRLARTGSIAALSVTPTVAGEAETSAQLTKAS